MDNRTYYFVKNVSDECKMFIILKTFCKLEN